MKLKNKTNAESEIHQRQSIAIWQIESFLIREWFRLTATSFSFVLAKPCGDWATLQPPNCKRCLQGGCLCQPVVSNNGWLTIRPVLRLSFFLSLSRHGGTGILVRVFLRKVMYWVSIQKWSRLCHYHRLEFPRHSPAWALVITSSSLLQFQLRVLIVPLSISPFFDLGASGVLVAALGLFYQVARKDC